MKSRDLVTFSPRAVNGFLNGAFRRTPADNANSGVLVTVAFGLWQLLGGGIELTEALLHHGCMIFRLVVRMAVFVMFQAGGDIWSRTRTWCGDGRNAAGGIGITSIARRSLCGMAVAPIAGASIILNALQRFHWDESATIDALYTSG